MPALIRNIIIVLALVLGVAFSFFNLQDVSVDLLWTTARAPLVVLLVIAFVLGFVIALLGLVYKLARLRARLSKSRRQLKQAEAEINNLRSMPIHDG